MSLSSSEAEDFPDEETSPTTFGQRLVGFASGFGEALARTAASATVLLSDAQLRRQGASVLSAGASKGLRGVQSGVVAGVQRLQAGPKQLRAALARVQQRIEEERLAVLLREQRDSPVDVQVGFQVYEDAPQELRSRLWMALLEHPGFVREHRRLMGSRRSSSVPLELPGERVESPKESQATPPAGAGSVASPAGRREAHDAAEDALATDGSPRQADVGAHDPTTAAAESPPANRAGGQVEDGKEEIIGPLEQSSLEETAAAHSADETGPSSHTVHSSPRKESGETLPTPFRTARPNATGVPGRGMQSLPAGSDDSAVDLDSPRPLEPASLSSSAEELLASEPSSSVASPAPPARDEAGWEVVRDGRPEGRLQGAALLQSASGSLPWSLEREALRNALMAAMVALPWPLPTDYPPDCRYSTLLQISVGQEEVDEVISRDIHRTFPEYPLFGAEWGQQALFRVGYCQGMAFVAGLVLFYVPEEPAFQLFGRLLSSSGPNLRRFYLPGLAGLKLELLRFDRLMQRHMPALRSHLEVHGVIPVLFASQWFLTAFACPFPVSFACRVIDGLLAENGSEVLLRVGLAIMAECEADLLLRDDFEDLLTFLKAEPLTWPAYRTRRVLDAAMNGSLDLGCEEVQGASEDGAGPVPPPLPRTPLKGADPAREESPSPAPLMAAADAVDADVAKQRAEMDEDFLEMVLELDHLWTGGAVSNAASAAYDEHLGGVRSAEGA
ncbi:hypothetical protein APUTEX25_005743 [Auxenochlorella protothecoides]|uniref:Rab-GAP TBC domain-containing protein n=1 Tax=Auxenochlorella protothecoides TaxID=3075 RepID=A0A3M7L2E1_AUXPR|nr:hypothetical protein APUTEX25_005743 [Auxenochlorella protothecoides]|eukprot:RMZ55702.1 hypothetical protein APUTEX25_005743 [Auxenochlorella protothecoides]